MIEPAPNAAWDLNALLHASQPRASGHRALAGALLILLALGAAVSWAAGSPASQIAVGVMMLGAILSIVLNKVSNLRVARAEQASVDAADELVQLRRWPEASALLSHLLSTPMRSTDAWLQSLLLLSMVLVRYHRFGDAIQLHDFLLDRAPLDRAAQHAVKLGRAMAMLRDERLFDADRAIADLRRSPMRDRLGGLALVELYRDVKTGHPHEALETFDARLAYMRDQLSHRVGDAYVLAARAHDLLGNVADARRLYEQATLLQPAPELLRRYPEVACLAGKYAASPAPAVMS